MRVLSWPLCVGLRTSTPLYCGKTRQALIPSTSLGPVIGQSRAKHFLRPIAADGMIAASGTGLSIPPVSSPQSALHLSSPTVPSGNRSNPPVSSPPSALTAPLLPFARAAPSPSLPPICQRRPLLPFHPSSPPPHALEGSSPVAPSTSLPAATSVSSSPPERRSCGHRASSAPSHP